MNFKEIPESEWTANGVEPWNPTDQEDSGYRDCPACSIDWDDDEAADGHTCNTCGNSGSIAWSEVYCTNCGKEIDRDVWEGMPYDPDFSPVCDDCAAKLTGSQDKE